jgi:hypothetical protein
MKMLSDEVTDMNDYGYFIDIDNGFPKTDTIIERNYYRPYEREKINNEATIYVNKNTNSGLFCVNTICCMAVSFVFIKLWVFPSKS